MDLRRVVPVNTEKIFESKEELDSYLSDLKQRLMNTRAFQNVEIVKGEVSPSAAMASPFPPTPSADYGSGTAFTETHSKPVSQVLPLSGRSLPATPQEDEIIPISLQIRAQDTKHLLILPYPKYDSNDGLIFKIKVKDVNFLGTMNTMDIGAFAGIKEDIKSGKQNPTFGAEFKYSYPFYVANFFASWNNNFDLQYTHGVNELEFYSGTGFSGFRPERACKPGSGIRRFWRHPVFYQRHEDFTSCKSF